MSKTLTLMLTDSCNCDCRYCYQKVLREKRIGSLSLDMIEKLDKLLPEFDSIQFFGGEPLVAEDFIFALDAHIDNLIAKNQLLSKPRYVFSSNLVELSKKFRTFLLKLKEEGTIFNFIITVDGNKSVHDKNRILHNREGSYRKIYKNYQFLMEHNMNCVENIYAVYNKVHYKNRISLRDCVEDIHKHFPTVPYITFNREDCFEETRVSEAEFFEQKCELMKGILDDIINGREEYKNCKPFFKKELLYMALSISSEGADCKKCVLEGKKLSIIPNGEVFMCVDYYYAKEKPIATLEQGEMLLEVLKQHTLSQNLKSKACKECPVRVLCRFCPRQKHTDEICRQNKQYYSMVLSYLERIYSKPDLIRSFVRYSGITDGILFLFYKYLRNLHEYAE